MDNEKYVELDVEEAQAENEEVEKIEEVAEETETVVEEPCAVVKKESDYELAVKAVVLGSLSIAFALFALIFNMLGAIDLAFIIAVAGVALAVIGSKAQKKCGESLDTQVAGMLSAAKTLSLIGTIASIFALAWVTISIITTIILLVAVFGMYAMMIVMAVMGMSTGM